VKWSSASRSRGVAYGAALFGAVVISVLRPPLAETFGRVRERSDVYSLPKPEQVVVASLGYRSALADYLFAHVLVWHGLRFGEKRRLEFAADYLDTVVSLDPTFRDPYYYGDTLIATQPVKPRREDYVRARALLERGMDARPYDTELWLSGGQFIAYVAAPWLEDPEERAAWRLAGGRRLARACELVGSNENIPFQCITAARLFEQAGEHQAAADFAERVLAWSDDEEIRDLARRQLEFSRRKLADDQTQILSDEIRAAWRADLPFVSLTKELVVGPAFDPARCAGGSDAIECSTTWAAWRARNAKQNR
jgi:tetratricopeptide (TPR) repeat protein